jgi:Uma2 family endonuclease
MAASMGGTITGEPMSWEDYWALPEELRAEYVDGLVYANPPATFNHQKICQRLRDAIVRQFGERCIVAVAVGWRLPTKRRILRIPDLMLLAAEPEGDVVTGPIPVAVEILSRNRTPDIVMKAREYLEAGAGQYWVVDPRDRAISVFAGSSGEWQQIGNLTDEAPSASFDVPPFGQISLVLQEILG